MLLGVVLGQISGPKPVCADEMLVGLDLEGLETFKNRADLPLPF